MPVMVQESGVSGVYLQPETHGRFQTEETTVHSPTFSRISACLPAACLCSRSLCHRGEGGGMSLNLSALPPVRLERKKRQKKRESEAGLCVPDSLGPGCFPPSRVCTCLPNKPPK